MSAPGCWFQMWFAPRAGGAFETTAFCFYRDFPFSWVVSRRVVTKRALRYMVSLVSMNMPSFPQHLALSSSPPLSPFFSGHPAAPKGRGLDPPSRVFLRCYPHLLGNPSSPWSRRLGCPHFLCCCDFFTVRFHLLDVPVAFQVAIVVELYSQLQVPCTGEPRTALLPCGDL